MPGGGAWHSGWTEAVGRVLIAEGHAWGGGVRVCGRVAGRATLCLPTVQIRACVDAWTGAASGGSLRAVAPVSVWVLGLMLYGDRVDYGNAPDNAYSQGDQELNTSQGSC